MRKKIIAKIIFIVILLIISIITGIHGFSVGLEWHKLFSVFICGASTGMLFISIKNF